MLPAHRTSDSSLGKRDIVLLCVLLAVLTPFVADILHSPNYPFEDAAILMRYARNLAAGHGVVWNPGEPPIDGATDFLLVVFQAVLVKLGLPLETSARGIAVVSHLAEILVVYLGCRWLQATSPFVALMSAACMAFGPGLIYAEAYFGTSFFSLFSLLSWCLAIALTLHPERRWIPPAFASIGLLTGLIRPEGVFLVIFMLLGVIWAQGLQCSRRAVLWFLGIFGSAGLAYFMWRWSYFSHPLPNPFYKKGGGHIYLDSLMTSLANTMRLTLPFLPALLYPLLRPLLVWGVQAPPTTLHRRIVLTGISTVSGSLITMAALARFGTGSPSPRGMMAFLPLVILLLGGLIAICRSEALAALLPRALCPPTQPSDPSEFRTDKDAVLKFRRQTFPLIPIVSFASLWVLLSDEMNYRMRFQYPLMGLVLVSWPLGFRSLRDDASRLPRAAPGRIVRWVPAGIVAIILLWTAADRLSRFSESIPFKDGRYDIAILLREYRDRGYTLVTTEAGLLPLYSEWRTIDAWGLNDAWIAHHGEITEGYLTSLSPEVLLVNDVPAKSRPATRRELQWNAMVTTLKGFAQKNNYVLAAAFGLPQAPNRHLYYVKKNSLESEQLVKKIRGVDYYWWPKGVRCLNDAIPKATD